MERQPAACGTLGVSPPRQAFKGSVNGRTGVLQRSARDPVQSEGGHKEAQNLIPGKLHSLSCAQLCPTLWNPQDCSPPGSLSMEFLRQEYWTEWLFPSPGDLPDPGIYISCIGMWILYHWVTWEAPVSLLGPYYFKCSESGDLRIYFLLVFLIFKVKGQINKYWGPSYSLELLPWRPFEKARKSVCYRAVVIRYIQVRHSQLWFLYGDIMPQEPNLLYPVDLELFFQPC